MTFRGVPWAIDSGVENMGTVMLAADLRAALASATREGVNGPSDLKVVPLATPGAGVRWLPGSASIENRSPGGAGQMYSVLNDDDEEIVTVLDPPASGTRSDLIVARVEDPQYEPWSSYDPDTEPDKVRFGPYVFDRVIEGVPSNLIHASQLGLSQSMIAVARVDWAGGVQAVTSANLVDLRQVRDPRRQRFVRALNTDYVHTLNSDALVQWPIGGSWTVSVPDWATKAVVTAFATQIDPIWSLVTPAATNGWITIRLGTSGGPAGYVQADGTVWEVRSANETTMVIGIGDEISVPLDMRGTTQTIETWANRNDGNAALRWNAGSALILDVEFLEAAD